MTSIAEVAAGSRSRKHFISSFILSNNKKSPFKQLQSTVTQQIGAEKLKPLPHTVRQRRITAVPLRLITFCPVTGTTAQRYLPMLSLCVLAGAFHPNVHKRLSPLRLTLCCVRFGLLLPINAFFMCHYITKIKQINIFLEIAAVPAPHFNLFILNIHV